MWRAYWPAAKPDDEIERQRVEAIQKDIPDEVGQAILKLVGFAKNTFAHLPSALELVDLADARMIDAGGYNCRLEIDGGVGPANIKEVAEAGVDTFVAGSAVFSKFNPADANGYDTVIGELRAELAKVGK